MPAVTTPIIQSSASMDPNCCIYVQTDQGQYVLPFSLLITYTLAGRVFYIYSVTVTLNASLLTGRQETTTTINGLLATDIVVGIQPLSSLPGNLSIGYAFVSAANTLKVAFSTPVVYTGNTNIPLTVCIMR